MNISYRRLYALLKKQHLNMSKLTHELNLSKSDIYSIENGNALEPDTLMKICNFLNCKVTDILEIKREDDEICTVSM